MRYPSRRSILCGAAGALVCAASPDRKNLTETLLVLRKDPDDREAFPAFLDNLPQVNIKEDGFTRTFYLFEGDLLQTRDEVLAALRAEASKPVLAYERAGELLVNVNASGRPTIWPHGQRDLTYSVDRGSFPTNTHYDEVITNMRMACNDWTSICPESGLTFKHLANLDGGDDASLRTFEISFSEELSGDFCAVSFFPNDPLYRRRLVVTGSYFTSAFDHIGILRHEVGHILGYRHEQIQGVAGCAMEDNHWKPLTAYDAHSVMHYMCGGGGTFSLRLTEVDKAGHRKIYGA